ncbi:sigma-54-dependent transcriptional regulator [Oceanidesulfovibrio marinus]|nr:sigma-54 dependent transcriptional regulator [Oceanidesulfovibrio marinus]
MDDMYEQFRILVVEDDPRSLDELEQALSGPGHEITTCQELECALTLAEGQAFDLVMTDLHTGGRGELSLLAKVKSNNPVTEVVIITGSSSVERAVEAMKRGALHYLTKPYSEEEVRLLVERVKEKRIVREELEELRSYVRTRRGPGLIGKSPQIQELKRLIVRVAPLDCTVLITGETGTGKELVSRMIHENSKRADKRQFAINCGSLSEELLCNELFGHEREAFTGAQRTTKGIFESLDGGTVLLDEIGEMPMSAQVQLLRVLQEKKVVRVGGTEEIPVDVRILAATNRRLGNEVAAGRFREDLYYRLNVFTMSIPPLRERADDIPLFCNYFLESYAKDYGKPVKRLSSEVLDLLFNYPFPGNVRELKNVIERAVILSDGEIIERSHLPARLRGQNTACLSEGEILLSLSELEERHIRLVLEKTDGNKSRAAQILGIDRTSLWRKMKRMGLADGAVRNGVA